MSRNLYYFNATNDLALATNNISFTPPANLQQFESDLATIPWFIAQTDDYLIVPQQPTNEHIDAMQAIGFRSPIFVLESSIFENHWATKNHIEAIKPWGWSRSVHTLFSDIKPYCSSHFKQSCNAEWHDDVRMLCSRKTAQIVLDKVLKAKHKATVSPNAIPEIVTNINRIEERIDNNEQLVIKLPWSSAGRGMLIVKKDLYSSANRHWIEAGIASQGFVMLEPWFDRKADFSFLFEYSNKKAHFLGVTAFETGTKGQFFGNYVHWPDNEIPVLTEALTQDVMADMVSLLSDALEHAHMDELFEGRLGIDAMLVWDNNSLLIHPCVEINFRPTIGHVALAIRNIWESKRKAFFQIGPIKAYKEALLMHGKASIASGEISKGILAVTPLRKETQFAAWLRIT